MNVFGPGFYTSDNKGDTALVDIYLAWIAEEFDADDVVLTSFTPAKDTNYFNIQVIDMPTRPYSRRHLWPERLLSRPRFSRNLLRRWRLAICRLHLRTLTQWVRRYRSHPRLTAFFTPRALLTVARAIDNADLCITVPGGYLNATTANADWWLFHVPSLALACEMGKPLVLSPCSIGPFVREHRDVASSILTRATAVLLREDTSLAIAHSLGAAPERLIRTPDMAFGYTRRIDDLDRSWAATILPGVENDYIGVSVRFHTFPGATNPRAAQSAYLDTVADSVEQIVKAYTNAVPVIVPQVLEDLAVGNELATRLRRRGIQPLNLSDNLTPLQLCALYERLRLLIGTRMHANILAMSVGTPVVAIGYEPKTHGILSDMGLLDWFIAIEDTGEGRLCDLALAQWEAAPALRAVAKDRAEVQAATLSAAATAVRKLLAN